MKNKRYVDIKDAKEKRLYIGCKVDFQYIYSEKHDTMKLKKDKDGYLYFISLISKEKYPVGFFGSERIVLLDD